MKGLPQAYNRDMQEDKERIFDAHDTVFNGVTILSELVDHTHFNKERLWTSCQKGFMEATALAEYLVAKGIFFRDAHHISGSIVQLAENENKSLADLDLPALKQICPEIEEDVYTVLSCDKIIETVTSAGGTGMKEIQKNLAYWEKQLQT
jgi:argininosuccinate lyase